MTDRNNIKWLWLAVGVFSLFLATGDRPLVLAAWIAPIFLLRFSRCSRPVSGFLLLVVLIAIAQVWGIGSMSPMPKYIIPLVVLISSLVDWLSLLLDRLLVRRLPSFLDTLFLPTCTVSLVAIGGLLGLGSWSGMAYVGFYGDTMIQIASITGYWGLVFISLWSAAVANKIWECGWGDPTSKKTALIFATVMFCIVGFGWWRLSHSASTSHSYRIACVMPSPVERKAMGQTLQKMLSGQQPTAELFAEMRLRSKELRKALLDRSKSQAQSGAKIIVWSEAGIFVLSDEETDFVEQARALARSNQIYLALAYAKIELDYADRLDQGSPFIANKLIFVTPDGQVAWEYHKSRLVPGTFETISSWPGDGQLNFTETPAGKVTGVICYDMDFPRLIRPAGRSGASIVFAPSHDWPGIKRTHALMARLRSIENGFALVRPTSGGLTIATDSRGRILSQADWTATGGAPLVIELPIEQVRTFYAEFGDLFLWFCFGALIALLGVAIFLPAKNKPSIETRHVSEGL